MRYDMKRFGGPSQQINDPGEKEIQFPLSILIK